MPSNADEPLYMFHKEREKLLIKERHGILFINIEKAP